MRTAGRVSLLIVVLTAGIGGAVLAVRGTTAPAAAAQAPSDIALQASDRATPGATSLPSPPAPGLPLDTNLFRNIARQENPIVVAIMTKARVDTSVEEGDDLFQRFFGRPQAPTSRVQHGLGSGFLISPDGEILTNNHVVADAESIEVQLFGDERKTYHATLVGRDPLTDSALIKVQNAPARLPVATLGDSDALEPGDWVMAIGNPFELGHTVTVGVVSFQGRPFQVEEGRWQKMIQTDASINPGNSGGPLINVRGEVVGINAAMLGAGTNGNIGIGFAVPINTVKSLLAQLRQGKVTRGRIGVQLRGAPITGDEATALGLHGATGAIVTAVERGSPADRAGLAAGDVIVGLDGKPVANADDIVPRVASTAPGSTIELTVVHDGRERRARVTVEELALESNRGASAQSEAGQDFGMRLGDVTGSIARQLQLPAGVDGAVVFDVADDSPAARAGLEQGDVVRSVNRRPVHNADEAAQALRRVAAGQPVFLLIWRDGNEMLVELQSE